MIFTCLRPSSIPRMKQAMPRTHDDDAEPCNATDVSSCHANANATADGAGHGTQVCMLGG